VEVIKLITRGTIEEDMLKLGETKLALDEAVAGEDDGAGRQAEVVTRSLMNALRRQLMLEEKGAGMEVDEVRTT
jgi:SWI/SNF-related matrix-associated actin-dependent regulator of chromatin subfamily A containing DEAD/H box 1